MARWLTENVLGLVTLALLLLVYFADVSKDLSKIEPMHDALFGKDNREGINADVIRIDERTAPIPEMKKSIDDLNIYVRTAIPEQRDSLIDDLRAQIEALNSQVEILEQSGKKKR